MAQNKTIKFEYFKITYDIMDRHLRNSPIRICEPCIIKCLYYPYSSKIFV